MTRGSVLSWCTALFVVAVLGMGCGARSSGSPSPAPAVDDTVTQLDPAAFRAAITSDAAVVINVHVPYEGNIPGTDSIIPFDEIEQRAADLPQEKEVPLYVYCRTGRMSATAILALQRMGYTNIIELKGGMDAWRQAGFAIEERPS